MNQSTARALPQSAISNRTTVAVLPTFSLTHIMARVKKENPRWSQGRLDAAENAYRGFLGQAKAQKVCEREKPSKDVDVLWHAHILYTKQYAKDCDNYFGYFLHHVPPSEGKTCCIGR